MKREDITALLPDITEEHLDKIMGRRDEPEGESSHSAE